ncbi:phage EaA protein [Klebsiella pneumoniae]|nr:phage EaA protein [Klebsiella pneumoniae]
MTDITELAQREKFEAWFKSSFHPDKTGPYIKDQLYFAWKAAGAELVEALEKAQQVDEELCRLLPPGAEYMDPPDGGDVTPLEGVRRMVADYRQRIAELESRTVKLPDLRQIVSGDRYVWLMVFITTART